jgi:hypothetical protein
MHRELDGRIWEQLAHPGDTLRACLAAPLVARAD